jgi:hypothetical protein
MLCEHPDLAMLRGDRYRVGEREFGSLQAAKLDLHRVEERARQLLVLEPTKE